MVLIFYLTNIFMDNTELLQELQGLRAELKNLSRLQRDVEQLQLVLRNMENKFAFLYNIKELRAGAGDLSFRLDRNGLWLGKELWTDIVTGVPTGTGIGMDGTFYGKGGVSGTVIIPDTGGSFTVQNGLVTSL